MNEKEKFINLLVRKPAELGKMLGFTDLRDTHNEWIRKMCWDESDTTIQAHRGSYKTTCISIALCILIVLKPSLTMFFMRKTDDDIKEVISQVKKMLTHPKYTYIVRQIYGIELELTKSSYNCISTNLMRGIKGADQLTGQGIGGSITGKHYDFIFTDDIVNMKDRASKAERERTKNVYRELQNIRNRGGRIFNTGTPWHPDDCFIQMPTPQIYDVYTMGLMNEEQIQKIKESTTASLWAANYELRHIPSDDVIFLNPRIGADPQHVEQGNGHVDSAFYGEDYTAYTIMNKQGDTYYVYGRVWRKHVDDVMDIIVREHNRFNAGWLYIERNADKGYVANKFKDKGLRPVQYNEHQNKFIKITTYLKQIWKNVVFVDGTDREYINQICDFYEMAEHDDAPDSCATLARIYGRNRGFYKGDEKW